MEQPVRTATLAAIIAAVVLAAGLSLVPARSASAGHVFSHWGQRTLALADRTGDPGWQAATRRAADLWTAVGADVRLTWSEGGVGCEASSDVIPICRDNLRRGWKGVAEVHHGGHIVRARIRFDDRDFSQAQKDNIACHEVGHVLGLHHSRSAASCLTGRSSSTVPDAHDVEMLRRIYGHGD